MALHRPFSLSRVAGTAVVLGCLVTGCSPSRVADAQELPPTELSSCPAPNRITSSFESGSFSPFQPSSGGERITSIGGFRGSRAVEGRFTTSSGDVVQGVTGHLGGQNESVLYVRWAYKQDNSFYNGGIKKLLRFRDESSSALMGTLTIHWGKFAWSWDGDNQTWWVNSITPDQLRGGWHWFEVMNDLSTPNTVKAKVWIDGQLVVDAVRTGFGYGGTRLGVAVINGVFNAPAGNGTEWTDDIAISTTCIPEP